MFESISLLYITAGYLCLLFILAYFAEFRESKGKSIVANPYVYSLSLAVYCTSWTFYGSVGKAATGGLSFLTIYLGPTLMVTMWWVIMAKVINIAREHRINTIADFIGSRYGNSIALSALVTIVATIGITPYLGLQVKAIISTFTMLSGKQQGSVAAGTVIMAIIAVFAVIFGVGRRGVEEKHVGLVFAVAFESIIKLAAFLAVGVYVTYSLFGGHVQMFEEIMHSDEYGYLTRLGGQDTATYTEWASLMLLSMMAIMFLPRQFQMAVVENYSTSHLRKAMWLFPLYMFLINLFVLPVAFGGLLLGVDKSLADYYVLSIPMQQGKGYLALFVFLGGFSAASSMIIVESLAISNMVMNNLVNPLVYRYTKMRGFSLVIDNMKTVVIMALVFVGYIFAVYIGDFYSLVDMGLKSFEAVTIFAPAFLLGLFWKRGTRKGAIAGITGGFVIWIYTLIIPALVKAGLLEKSGLLAYIMSSDMLNPHALFGLKGLDRWSNSLFWGLFVNLGLYIGISLFTQQEGKEERQALLFVDSYSTAVMPSASSIDDIEDMLVQVVGNQDGRAVIERFLERRGKKRTDLSHEELIMLKDEARKILSSTLGSTIASVVLEDRLSPSEKEREELVSSIRQIGKTLMLSRQELARANRDLALLKEFSENIIESLPLGVATLDGNMKVRYWNASMERITGVPKASAMGRICADAMRDLKPCIFTSAQLMEGDIECSSPNHFLKGYISKLTGGQEGYVIVLEDITEKRKIEEELFRTSKHASIGRLAAGVSHEIGNPLASISSLVQELVAEPPKPDFMNSCLGTVHQHVDRIARIVRSLGEFARISPRRKVPMDIKDSINKTLELVRFDKNFRNIEIKTGLGDVPRVLMDPDQMQQVFLNLALNARDAMPGGGTIEIVLRNDGPNVRVEFSDTGYGIPEGIREQVFDPFFTTKGPAGGTGLGLSISYSIIKDHGGSIDIKPGNPVGTTFIILLPSADGQEQ